MSEVTRIEIKGELFRPGTETIVKVSLGETVQELTKEGKSRLRSQLRAGRGMRTGAYADSIHGEVKDSLRGEITDTYAPIQRNGYSFHLGPWLNSGATRSRAGRKQSSFRGIKHFKNTRAQLSRLEKKGAEDAAQRVVVRLSK